MRRSRWTKYAGTGDEIVDGPIITDRSSHLLITVARAMANEAKAYGMTAA
jgi:hypothetical protein